MKVHLGHLSSCRRHSETVRFHCRIFFPLCLRLHCHNRAPAKKLKVNLTLPLEVDQTTTMYSWKEPSTIAILFCCQAWIGADYEKRALFFFMSSRDRVAMATLVLDLRMHPFVVPTTILLDITHTGLVLALWYIRESEDIAILGSIWWPSPTTT